MVVRGTIFAKYALHLLLPLCNIVIKYIGLVSSYISFKELLSK